MPRSSHAANYQTSYLLLCEDAYVNDAAGLWLELDHKPVAQVKEGNAFIPYHFTLHLVIDREPHRPHRPTAESFPRVALESSLRFCGAVEARVLDLFNVAQRGG